ncbi:hypothetical protein DER45DRAFT_557021 [Fusarium avenaceum]|nr:hypothetical protein DER45DRAFT_557021 [Fusarium avenaceum]
MLRDTTSIRPFAALVISTVLILTLLLFYRIPTSLVIIPTTSPNEIQTPDEIQTPTEIQMPTERFIISFGDSYSRTGLKMNSTYTRTGTGIDDMERARQPRSRLLEGPSPKNPIGNPPLPGTTSSGGNNYVTYMATELNDTLTLAYNFARSAAVVDAGIIPTRLNTTFTFGHQIIHFNDTIGHRPDYAAWTAGNAVATIWFGMNDVPRSVLMNGNGSREQRLVASNRRMFELTEILYEIGVRNFVFIEVPPLELLPARQQAKLDPTSQKIEQFVYGKTLWNEELKKNTLLFQQSHSDARVAYVEVWDLFYRAFLHPWSLGARTSTCIDSYGKTCLWADPWHPGRKIHQLIGARIVERAWNMSPFST